MSKPELLAQVDALLLENEPARIRAFGDGDTISEILVWLNENEPEDEPATDVVTGKPCPVVPLHMRQEWLYAGVPISRIKVQGSGIRLLDVHVAAVLAPVTDSQL